MAYKVWEVFLGNFPFLISTQWTTTGIALAVVLTVAKTGEPEQYVPAREPAANTIAKRDYVQLAV